MDDLKRLVEEVGGVEMCLDDRIYTYYQIIWKTSGYKRQVDVVDRIVQVCNEDEERQLLQYVVENFEKIEMDRRDKFYYLIRRTYCRLSFEEMISVRNNDVLVFLCRELNRNKCTDWNDDVFLRFIVGCKPWIAGLFSDVKIDERTVRPYILSYPNIPCENKCALYRLFC
jgi:hypothetical protein